MGRGGQLSRILSPEILELEGRMATGQLGWAMEPREDLGLKMLSVLSIGTGRVNMAHSHRRWRPKPSLC